MAHEKWSEFLYYNLRARLVLTGIENFAVAMSADPNVPANLKLKYQEIQAKAMLDRLNVDHDDLRKYVLHDGEGVSPNMVEVEQIQNLTKVFGDGLKAYILIHGAPLDEPTLCVAITELNHGGGGLNLPPPPATLPPPPPPPTAPPPCPPPAPGPAGTPK